MDRQDESSSLLDTILYLTLGNNDAFLNRKSKIQNPKSKIFRHSLMDSTPVLSVESPEYRQP